MTWLITGMQHILTEQRREEWWGMGGCLQLGCAGSRHRQVTFSVHLMDTEEVSCSPTWTLIIPPFPQLNVGPYALS